MRKNLGHPEDVKTLRLSRFHALEEGFVSWNLRGTWSTCARVVRKNFGTVGEINGDLGKTI